MLSLGIDVGGTTIKAGLITTKGEILAEIIRPTPVADGVEGITKIIVAQALELASNNALTLDNLQGVGIGIPGYTNYSEGIVIFAPNLNWREVPLKKILEQELNLPVFLDNDVNAAALGEQYFGAGRGIRDFVILTVGTGLGGALVLKDEVYRGSLGFAGEVGHMIIQEPGYSCGCGRTGCLETLTSATAMLREAKSVGLEVKEAREIFLLAAEGNQAAQKIIENSAYYLGLGISNLINLLNPQRVIIGGGVSKAGNQFLEPITRYVEKLSANSVNNQVELVLAELGNRAGIIGAGMLPHQKIKS